MSALERGQRRRPQLDTVRALSTALDLPAAARDALLRAACDGRQTLLVLDNCEHVLDGMPLVARLLAAAPSLRVLATSRTPLRIGGEREYPVGPLALEADRADERAVAPAVQLFVDRVLAVDPDFRLTDANAAVVAAICRRLDALPLALELAAPWLKVLRPQDLLRRLQSDVLPPTMERRDLPERQQTMNATVAWSYRLLSADEQRAFRRLGALPGPFPIEAAAALLSDGREAPFIRDATLHVAAGLIERSLLLRVERAAGTRPLYRMLETVRAYAVIELAASLPAPVQAGALTGVAVMCYAQGDLDRAREAATLSLAVSDRADAWAIAIADDILGHVELAVGNLHAARDQFTRARARFSHSAWRGASAIPWRCSRGRRWRPATSRLPIVSR